MRSNTDVEAVRDLIALGLSDREVAQRTGVPRITVNRWRRTPPLARPSAPPPGSWAPADGPAYCYLLGMYLGDGHLAGRAGGTLALRFTLDARYPGIVAETAGAIRLVEPDAPVATYERLGAGAVVLSSSHPVWPAAFPQHGAGPKHERTIALEDWQLGLTRRYPAQLVRGLIHSDGSRTINRFSVALPSGSRTYEYVRYFFTNASADIREIFRSHCELISVRCTQSNARNLSVADRVSVAILDAIAGPKR